MRSSDGHFVGACGLCVASYIIYFVSHQEINAFGLSGLLALLAIGNFIMAGAERVVEGIKEKP